MVKKYIIDNDKYEILVPGKGVTVTSLDAFCKSGGSGEPEIYIDGNEQQKQQHLIGDWICGHIRSRDMINHITNKCPFRIVPCPLECKQHIQERQVKLHIQEECLLRQVKCPDCCKLLPYSILDSHMLHVS